MYRSWNKRIRWEADFQGGRKKEKRGKICNTAQ